MFLGFKNTKINSKQTLPKEASSTILPTSHILGENLPQILEKKTELQSSSHL